MIPATADSSIRQFGNMILKRLTFSNVISQQLMVLTAQTTASLIRQLLGELIDF
jgi:hypothetical protein